MPPTRPASRSVTVQSSLGLTGVFRAIGILATSVGQLELAGYKRGRELDTLPLIVERPDPDRSRRSFLKRTVVCLGAHGEAFWRVYRDQHGRVSSVQGLDPNLVYVGRDGWDGRRYFDYRDPWRVSARPQRLAPVRDRGRTGDILHLKLLEVPGLENGLGPIQACRLALVGALDLNEYGNEWFRTGEVPSGILSTTQQLTPDQAEQYRERWQETMDGHGTAVLGGGLSYEPVLLKPADAQFLESRQFSITEQARMFGIPAPLLLAEIDGSAMTYQNMEHVDLQLMKHTVMDYLNVIEDGLSELLPFGTEARFHPFSAMRSDNKTRAEVNEIYVRMGAKSLEQVAREESFELPPADQRPRNVPQEGEHA